MNRQPAADGLSSRLGAGCGVLFLLPFAAVGSFLTVQAMRLGHSANWRDAVLVGVGALTFAGVGFGGLLGLRVGYRRLKVRQALKTLHPNEPWLWRADWANGQIEDSSRADLLGAWIFAAFWNLVSWPAGYFGLKAVLQQNNPAGFIALLFPLIGAWLLARAVLTTVHRKKYGVSRLELSTLPAAIGQKLAGTVSAPVSLRPPEGFQARLTCVRRVTTRSGKSSSTRENILWQDEQRTEGQQSRDYRGMRTAIPVSFQVPPDVEPCDESNPNDRVVWRLQVTGSVPGVDYASTFEVPVYRTAATAQLLSDSSTLVGTAPLAEPYHQPAESRVKVSSTGRGTEILFPRARNIGAALGITAFLCLWCALLVLEIYFKAPLIAPVVTGAFGLLLVIGVLDQWLSVQRITVGGGALTTAKGYLVPGHGRRLAAGDIAAVETAIGMQVGSTPYYDIVVRDPNGKKIVVARSVRDKREAEWLASTIRNALKS